MSRTLGRLSVSTGPHVKRYLNVKCGIVGLGGAKVFAERRWLVLTQI